MAEPVGGRREFQRHEQFVTRMKEPQVPRVYDHIAIFIERQHISQHILENDRRQKIVQQQPLIMKPDLALYPLEIPIRMVGRNLVMKAVPEALHLRNDDVFVVPWVANDCAIRIRRRWLTSRQVFGSWIFRGAAQRLAQYKAAPVRI